MIGRRSATALPMHRAGAPNAVTGRPLTDRNFEASSAASSPPPRGGSRAIAPITP